MKLSEAISLGAMMGPKANGLLFGPKGGSCALGSAMLAVGASEAKWNGWTLFHTQEEWRWAKEVVLSCPLCSRKAPVVQLIPHLNNGYTDCHDQTREWIASWVATVEPQEVLETSPTAHLPVAEVASVL